MIRILSLLILLSAPTLVAQESPLVGRWSVSYAGGATMDNGVMTPIMATGVLVISAKADSLVGELTMDPSPELGSRPMVRMAAGKGAGEATFTSLSEATISMNGDEQQAKVISTWKLSVSGDSLTGTVERQIEGFAVGNQPPQPLTGTRQKH